MAALVVLIRDNVNEDFYLDTKCLKRGDVIDVLPDDWMFGEGDRTHPDWRIIIAPDLSLQDARDFLAPQFDKDPERPSATLRVRATHINLDDPSLPKEFQAYIDDDTRTSPMMKLVSDPKDAGVFQTQIVTDVIKFSNGAAIKTQDGKLQPATTKEIDQPAILLTPTDFIALKTIKPAIQDPAVIGIADTSAVIG